MFVRCEMGSWICFRKLPCYLDSFVGQATILSEPLPPAALKYFSISLSPPMKIAARFSVLHYVAMRCTLL